MRRVAAVLACVVAVECASTGRGPSPSVTAAGMQARADSAVATAFAARDSFLVCMSLYGRQHAGGTAAAADIGEAGLEACRMDFLTFSAWMREAMRRTCYAIMAGANDGGLVSATRS